MLPWGRNIEVELAQGEGILEIENEERAVGSWKMPTEQSVFLLVNQSFDGRLVSGHQPGAGPPGRLLSRQRRLVPLRTLVQSAAPAAGRVAGGTLIECSPFTGRNGPFQVTVIYTQVITAGHDGWRCPIYLDYPEIKHVSEIPKCQKPLQSRFGSALPFLGL